ncbi:MAG: gamma carbonic anhydrase family protein [endosymbiont of Seepiophila jonesi]|uniref:Gamma carbonic anhydrase family protein n=1 Tax=endosymbiont of Lamellibrachia luymesi TaxID=2200907 RepID=A0A370DZD2_9GAMM|nr:MAG: gamma carbonic anhydrase family protein [endosymbiont of Seepiophila jonesi]RDH92132.1 MAG: gamma carbonic anhydrase family protein [endosymbiont of Lamellibrachia luymesi]
MSNIRPFESSMPQVATDAWIDETAVVIGNVSIGSHSSVWPMTVIRGDVHAIRIGSESNVQDGCVLHVSHDSKYQPGGSPLILGDRVTVGHKAVLHGCNIADSCFIGMGCTILDGAVLESRAMLGAGSLVPSGKHLEGGYLWVGTPARRVRPLSDQELEYLDYSAAHYVRLMKRHAGR